MNRLAIIDIGSNSIRMIIFEVDADGSYKLVDDVKESVRLGENLGACGAFSEEKMNRAIDTLRFFADLKDALRVEHVICVATEAVRKASNGSVFLQMAKEQLNLDIRILTGDEEAYYDYFGAVNSFVLPDCLIMDIGGSSTELIRVRQNQIVHSVSLPFGSITVSGMLPKKAQSAEQMKKAVRQSVGKLLGGLDWIYGTDTLIGIGGSFRNLAKIDMKQKNYPLDIIHNYRLKPADVSAIFKKLVSLPAGKRKHIKGLSRDRADILPGALAEISLLLEMTGITDLVISGAGLREGLFFDRMLKDQKPLEDVFGFSVQNAMRRYGIDQGHATHVWELARQLYEQLGNDLGIDGTRHKVLKAAALLHDSGIHISYYDHHKHSFYTILNSHINGLTHQELIMAAWIAALHRKSELKVPQQIQLLLSEREILTVKQLGVLLQIAESLDRRRTGYICRVRCQVHPNEVRIIPEAVVSPLLEIKDAQNAAQKFQSVFQRSLVVQLSGAASPPKGGKRVCQPG